MNTIQINSVDRNIRATVFAFCRMNPITLGHAKLIDHVKELADKHNGDHIVVLSTKQDSKKNPLHIDDKVSLARKYFPNTNIRAATKEFPTFLHYAKLISDNGIQHLLMVAGSDRIDEYHFLLHKYNGLPGQHNFKKISVVSAGQRNIGSNSIDGISASKLREAAIADDYEKFKLGLPYGPETLHEEMYKKVRNGLKVTVNKNNK